MKEMDVLLNDIEVRVLASLTEKEITTPDYYPLTLHALRAACNQKSNRHPVVSFEEKTVVRGLDGLRDKGLVNTVYKADSRVPKYQHFAGEKFALSGREIAVLTELMLRGPQTLGEIRGHGERMYEFSGLAEVEEVLQGLMGRERALVVKLPRQAGRKEQRYMHLLSGQPEIPETEGDVPQEPATVEVRAENERIASLEAEVLRLRSDLGKLIKAFEEFRSQF
jgi:uncharacterized protein YceH (UPF0502 family)